jgi:hypothetical protein
VLTHKAIFSAAEEGRALSRPWIKNPSVVTASGIAVDLTFFGRYPAANYMTDGTPLAAQALRRSTHGGFDHGENKGADWQKLLSGLTILSTTSAAAPMCGMVMDYLLYYPLVPMEDIQEMDNTITLPRYADGKGVRIMLVEQFPYVGGVTCRVTYTNELGVAGRMSPIMTINTQTALGTIATSAPATAGCPGTFVPLQDNDGGVRSVESIEFFTADAGNLAIVLVRPLASFGTYETTCPSEWNYDDDLFDLPPIIIDDAYLSAVVTPTGSLSGAIIDAQIRTKWVAA